MAENLNPEAVPEGEPGSLVALLWRDPRLNVFCSLLWLPLGWTIASWAPWLGQGGAGVDEVVNVLAPLTTFLLVAWNLCASVRLVHRSGHTLSALPLTLVQILLFTLLFYQFACHVGAEQYTWEHSPGVREWIVFAVAHAARATDVFDGIEAYGVHIQSIRNVGHLVSLTLILFHLIITVFFLSLFVEWVNRLKGFLWSNPTWRLAARSTVIGVATLLLVSFLFSAFIWPGWRWSDIGLWPVDNALRVVDFLDILEVYQYRFHKLPLFAWESTLTFACRFLMAVFLAGLVGRFTEVFRLRWLAGFALDAGELATLRETHKNPRIRELAERRLERLQAHAPELAAEHRRWLSLWVPLAAAGVLLVWVAVPWLLPGGDKPAESLAKVAIEASLPPDPKPWQVDRALSALERMGSAGVEAVPILVARESELPLEQRLRVIETLGFLGPGASDPLEALLEDENESVRLAAVSALRQVGPAAAPALIRGFGSVYPEVSAACVAGIRQHGNADAQRLADNLDPNNVIEVVRLLDEVDPYWGRRASQNPAFGKAVAARQAGRAVAAGGSLFLPISEAVEQLREIGPLAAAETAPLEPLLFGDDADLSSAALEAYIAVDRNWHATPTGQRAFTLTVNRFVTASDAPTRRRTAEVLGRFEGQEEALGRELQKTPKKAVAALRDVSRDTAEPVRRFAGLALVLLLAAADESAKKDAASALVSLDGPAREAASAALAERQPLSLNELKAWLAGRDESPKFLAIRALSEQGAAAHEAIEDLAPLLGEEKFRQPALEALLKIDPTCHRRAVEAWVVADKRQAIVGCAAMLTGDDPAAQTFAARMSPWSGLSAGELAALLARLVRPEDSELQRAIVATFGEFDPEGKFTFDAVRSGVAQLHEVLLFWLKHESQEFQRLGEKLAEKLGTAPEQLIGQLLGELNAANAEPRRSLLLALARLDAGGSQCSLQLAKLPDAARAVALLRGWLSDSDLAVRKFGVMVAGRLGAGARGVTAELFALLADSDADVRKASWFALMRVDTDGSETAKMFSRAFSGDAIEQVLLGIADTDRRIQSFAVTVTRAANTVSADSAAALAPLLTNDNENIRAAALRLLKDISPDKIAEAEAGIYDRAIKQAADSLSKSDRSAAGRVLELCPAGKRDWVWNFLKRQAEGASPRSVYSPSKSATASLGFSPDGLQLTVVDSSPRITTYDVRSVSAISSLTAKDVIDRGLRPAIAKPDVEKPKSEAALRAEMLAQERREAEAMKAEMAGQAKLDKLYAALDRAMNIADFKAQDAAVNRIQKAIDAELAAQDKAAAIASAKLDRAEAARRPEIPIPKTPLKGISVPPAIAAISGDGSRMLAAAESRTMKLWDVTTGKVMPPLKVDWAVESVNFSGNGRRVVIAHRDAGGRYQFGIYDGERGAKLGALTSIASYSPDVALSHDGTRLAIASFSAADGRKRGLNIWNVENLEAPPLFIDTGDVRPSRFALSRDGVLVAGDNKDGVICVWNARSGDLVCTTTLSFNAARGLDFSPDKSLLAMLLPPEGLHLLDARTGKLLLVQQMFTQAEWSNSSQARLQFSPDGSRLAASAGPAVKLFSVKP